MEELQTDLPAELEGKAKCGLKRHSHSNQHESILDAVWWVQVTTSGLAVWKGHQHIKSSLKSIEIKVTAPQLIHRLEEKN